MRLIALAVVAAACGHHRPSSDVRPVPQSRAPIPRRPADPAEIAGLRELLKRYAPLGARVVAETESLPRRFLFGNTTVTVSHGGGFNDYFSSTTPDDLPDDVGTAVHEVYHAYNSLMGYQLLATSGRPKGQGADAVFVGGEPVLVPRTRTFPARELDASFPSSARTSRYRTYVSPSTESQSTQQNGIYGLLDEFAAYYHSSAVLVAFWPWVRDESPIVEQLLVNYVARFHEMWVPYAEFKLFMLHWLWVAKNQHPEIYRDVVGNAGFRRAFEETDAAWRRLLDEAGRLEPIIHGVVRQRGLDAGLDNGVLTFDGRPFRIRDAAYPDVVRQFERTEYREILDAIR